jgi:hypothetical protein
MKSTNKSIKELRKICQSPVKGKDGEFCDLWYRPVSIYLTRFLLCTPISAGQVTLLSIISGLAAAMLMVAGSSIKDIISAIFLQLYWLLDFSDGEVSRFRKTDSLTGHYLDFLAHYIVFPIFLIGMTFGAYKDVKAIWVFIFGFSAIFCVSMYKDIVSIAYLVACYKKEALVKDPGPEGVRGLMVGLPKQSHTQPINFLKKIKVRAENILCKFPRLKVTLFTIATIFIKEIGSEAFIIFSIFFPLIGDLIWGGVNFSGKHYRFMTLYLVLLGGVSPIYILVKIVENVKAHLAEQKYRNLFVKQVVENLS